MNSAAPDVLTPAEVLVYCLVAIKCPTRWFELASTESSIQGIFQGKQK